MWVSRKKYYGMLDELDILRNPDNWINVLEDGRFTYEGLGQNNRYSVVYTYDTKEGSKSFRFYARLKTGKYLDKMEFVTFLLEEDTIAYEKFVN